MRHVFLVGAAKSGTTSLMQSLSTHPQISCSSVKEPFYFIKDFGTADSKDNYEKLFKITPETLWCCEGSTAYLFPEYCAADIKAKYPDSKIIIVLRNPAEMAFSFWKHNRVHSNENISFQDAISDKERLMRHSADFKRGCQHWWGNFLYIERALYFEQVKRYLEVFGADNVLIIRYEDIKSHFKEVILGVHVFLGVKLLDTAPVIETNVGGETRFEFIRKLRQRRYPLLRKFIPFRYRAKLLDLTRRINVKPGGEKMSDDLKMYLLQKYFSADIKKLEELLGRKMGWLS